MWFLEPNIKDLYLASIINQISVLASHSGLIHNKCWRQIFNIGAVHDIRSTYAAAVHIKYTSGRIIYPSTLHLILDISKEVAAVPLLTAMLKTACAVGSEAGSKGTCLYL